MSDLSFLSYIDLDRKNLLSILDICGSHIEMGDTERSTNLERIQSP